MSTQLELNPSADGYVSCSTGGSSWHSAVEASGITASNLPTIDAVRATSDNVADKWTQIIRTFFSFDTSGLPDGCTILSAILSLYGYDKDDDLPGNSWSLGVYSATLIGPTIVTYNDFQNAGTSLLSNVIAYASWAVSGNVNQFTLNATGLAYISKTSYTIVCLRDVLYDVADELDPNNHDPVWTSYVKTHMRLHGSGTATPAYKPKLTITYDVPAPSNPSGGAYFARGAARAMSF